MRDSPALAIIPNLIDNGATIQVHGRQGMGDSKNLLPEMVQYFDDA